MNKVFAAMVAVLSVIALSGCDSKSEDGRFEYKDITGGAGHLYLMTDNYTHKYYFYNDNGGTPTEITAAQAGSYADHTEQAYHEPVNPTPQTVTQQPAQQPTTPIIINNRND